MIEDIAKKLVGLKKDLAQVYDGDSQIQEAIPVTLDAVPRSDLNLLHKFAKRNPIYYGSFERTVDGVPCVVYEGDINKYWLGSIQHESSSAPFSPTWMISAYAACMCARDLGYSEIIDVGSGDGRIAFCAKVLGMESHSIEIDNALVELQKNLAFLDFHPCCSDAAKFDYSSLNLEGPAFFIGGLAQMGGSQLASEVIKTARSIPIANAGWIFAGTCSQKYAPDPKNEAGWGTLIERNGLKPVKTITLPTAWTFHESDETPYVFAR